MSVFDVMYHYDVLNSLQAIEFDLGVKHYTGHNNSKGSQVIHIEYPKTLLRYLLLFFKHRLVQKDLTNNNT